MGKNAINITESEYEIMKILWGAPASLTLGDVLRALPQGKWSGNTVGTLLGRLVGKQAVGYEKKGKTHYYSPLIKQDAYNLMESKSFLTRVYNGSVKHFVASLYENKAISPEEIEELKKLFDLNQ